MNARFERLVAPVLGDLYRFARRLAGDAAGAEDLLQASLERGMLRLGQLESDGAFRSWQSRVLYRTFLDDRAKRREVPVEAEALERAAPTPTNPHDRVVAAQIGGRVRDALDRLPEEQRAAVWLVDGQGCSYGEAARILDVAPGTAASRVARGRAALRVSLARVAADHGISMKEGK